MSRSPVDQALWDAVGQLELPIMLIDLNELTVCALSGAALKYVGLPPAAVVGQPVTNLLEPEDRAKALVALGALRAGIIDFYRANRRLGGTGTSGGLITGWVRAVDFGDQRAALAEVTDGSAPRPSPLAEYLGREPPEMAVGTTDSSWVVTSVSVDIASLLGVTADKVIGRRLLSGAERREIRRLLDAGRSAHDELSVSLRIRMRDAGGGWRWLGCVLTSLVGSADRCFILIPDPEPAAGGPADRTSQLERHLWRIAAEIEASGILQRIGNVPDPSHFPELGTLSARQWEVLSRLMAGERVPAIASALYVSQSTVRNHLAAIFERFGVHSQAELLALLATEGEPSS